jgi:Asp-tRNA(Asn)/Glu-tRNA(Gln) amidotransferase A subunit family amidase
MPHRAPYLAPASIPVDPLVRLSAGELASAIRRKAVSCVETMRAYLDHIERVNGAVNALISLRDRATCSPKPRKRTRRWPVANTTAGCTGCRRRRRISR